MQIQLNRKEIDNLVTELDKRDTDENEITIKQKYTSIGIKTVAIVEDEEIDITDYNVW